MTRIALVAAVLAAAAPVTMVIIPALRRNLAVGSQAGSTSKTGQAIPNKPRPINKQRALSTVLEDALYRVLKRDRAFSDPDWAFVITVRDVREKTLLDVTFKHRASGKVNEFDTQIQAKRAVLHFDPDATVVRAVLEEPEIQRLVRDADIHLLNNEHVLKIPVPKKSRFVREHARPPAPSAQK
jgi:hypothetical protein